MDPLTLTAVGIGIYALVKKQDTTPQKRQGPGAQPQALPAAKGQSEVEKLLSRSQDALVKSSTMDINVGAIGKTFLTALGAATTVATAIGVSLGPILAIAAFIIVAVAAITVLIIGLWRILSREFRRQIHAVQDAFAMFAGFREQTAELMIAASRDAVREQQGRELNEKDLLAVDMLHKALCLGFYAQWFDCLKKAAQPRVVGGGDAGAGGTVPFGMGLSYQTNTQILANGKPTGFVQCTPEELQWKEYRGLFLSDDAWDVACQLALFPIQAPGMPDSYLTPGDFNANPDAIYNEIIDKFSRGLDRPWHALPLQVAKLGITEAQFNKAYENGMRQGNAVFYLKMCSVLDASVSLITIGREWENAHIFTSAQARENAANAAADPDVISLYRVTKLVTQTQIMPWPTGGTPLPPAEIAGVFADEIRPNGDFVYKGALVNVRASLERKTPVFESPKAKIAAAY